MLSCFLYVKSFMTDRLRRDDRGATMVEYALLVAFIAIVALVGVKLLGSAISTLFSSIAGDI